MKFSAISLHTCLAATALFASNCNAYTPGVPKVTPVTQSNALDNNADIAMSQYEAALKAAFEQASSTAAPDAPEAESSTASATFAEQVEEQEQAIDQYEAALKAALESTSAAAGAPSSISFGEAEPVANQDDQNGPNWESISENISSQIEKAESKIGAPLSAAAKGEIVGTVLAGSAVLGTAAINSPLLMGAALGYASTHVLSGKRGEDLARVSKDAFLSAVTFTQTQLDQEEGDISKASARIMQHLQHEAQNKAMEVGKVAQTQAHQVTRDITNAPTHLVEEGKKIIASEDFKKMPNRTFKAVQAFLGSDEVKRAKESVVKSIKDGLESDELKAVKDRATRSLKEI
ncbi:unnamed protein product [Pseudo-nitzschia multistriata]|uniref:Uncharacterized protein n=1 Tax=Pseudo-nitzschia multistriata TaxID=183589 RepID=A0A448YWF0_9STRA|nr:unnamed protein product [Pseudo-nitzschia multistriata]